MHRLFFLFILLAAPLSSMGCKSLHQRSNSQVKEPVFAEGTQVPGEELRCMCVGEWFCNDDPDTGGTAEAKDFPSEVACFEELKLQAQALTQCASYTIAEDSFSSECVRIKAGS